MQDQFEDISWNVTLRVRQTSGCVWTVHDEPSHGRTMKLTQPTPVSTKTYSSLAQSSKTYNPREGSMCEAQWCSFGYSPIVLLLATHTNALKRRRGGSNKKTFITTPVVWKDVSGKKMGLCSCVGCEGVSKRIPARREPRVPIKRPPGQAGQTEGAAQGQMVCVGISR